MSLLNYDNLEIGQVIYVVSDEETKIIPVVVSEQVTVKTLGGNTTNWKVIHGPSQKRKTIQLEKIQGEKFLDLKEAKTVLVQRFSEYLNDTIHTCEKKVNSWYGEELIATKTNSSPKKKKEDSFDTESLFESIEEEQQQDSSSQQLTTKINEPRLSSNDTPEIRRAKMRAMLEAESEESNTAVQKVTMPDGNEVLIKVPSI